MPEEVTNSSPDTATVMDMSEASHTASSNEILQLPDADVAAESLSAAQTATGILRVKIK